MQQKKKKTKKEKIIQHLASLQQKKRYGTKFWSISTFVAISVFVLLIYALNLKGKTVINFFTLVRISLIMTIVLLVLLHLVNKSFFIAEEYKINIIIFLALSFLVSSSFVLINFIGSNSLIETHTLPILDKRQQRKTKRSELNPVAKIKFNKEEIWLYFKASEKNRLKNADSIIIDVYKGLFNFRIVERYDVVSAVRIWHE